MLVKIKEEYSDGLDSVTYELEVKTIYGVVEAMSSLLNSRPDILSAVISCEDPKAIVTITR